MSGEIADILRAVGLPELLGNFEREKVTSLEMANCIQDLDLQRLGLVTIGDRVRFREESRRRSGKHSIHTNLYKKTNFRNTYIINLPLIFPLPLIFQM